jgi:hypothetical protein
MSASTDSESLAKTVLQIVSFYNSCGGYLIYGVMELEKDLNFTPSSIEQGIFNTAQLRDKIKHYTGTAIDCTYSELKIKINNAEFMMGVLHIPKRDPSKPPVSFTKNGPNKKNNGKPVFQSEDTYFRFMDECKKAITSGDWQVLFSDRNFSYKSGLELSTSDINRKTIAHNLPDKTLIFSKFVGRENILSELWSWLIDDFEYVKILSGDGGKGKTSIAYEFCRTFIEHPPIGFERVLWLSVKEKQFSGITNSYYELREADFSNCSSFLICLAANCALDPSDYQDASDKTIKTDLKQSLPLFPSIIVVDDIDSLDDDEQKRVVDACRQLGSMNVRYLITTRKKHAYSSDICLDIKGLDGDDFKNYIKTITEKYSIQELKAKELELLHTQTDGSPLLASSILRLFKQGLPLTESIREWKGQAGEDARNAAIKREIKSLSVDAKRILLVISILRNCSFSEIKQIAGVERIKLVDCLEEIQSLFLVNEPRIIDTEERFSVSNTTSLVVAEIKDQLAFDYKKIQEAAKRFREKPVGAKEGNRKRVGLAINQAIALLNEGRSDDAIKTIDAELKSFKNNSDLLLMKARCFYQNEQRNFEIIRQLSKSSIDEGQNKELAYEYWYVSEEHIGSINGMLEVSSKAVQFRNFDTNKWLERLANSYVRRSALREGEDAIKDIIEASTALTKTLDSLSGAAKDLRIQELYSLHDLLWIMLEASKYHSWLSIFDEMYKLIKQGDSRTSMYRNAARCLLEAKSEKKMTEAKLEAYSICKDKFIILLESRSLKDIADRPFGDLIKSLDD